MYAEKVFLTFFYSSQYSRLLYTVIQWQQLGVTGLVQCKITSCLSLDV